MASHLPPREVDPPLTTGLVTDARDQRISELEKWSSQGRENPRRVQ